MAADGIQPVESILGPDDPPPVEVLRAGARSPFFLTCEHAGRTIPKRLGTLGLEGPDLERHIAWDIGAAGVTRRLSERLGAHAVLQAYSRLVVDCNRWTHAEDYITAFSEDTAIPGNEGVTEAEAEARTREIYDPYHNAIHLALEERIAAGRPTVLVAVHTCTPVYLGVHRPWHIGVLYERDRRLAGILLDLLGEEAHLEVGDNEPYYMTDQKDYAVPVHGERRGIPHVEFEIRQDLVATPRGEEEWAERLHFTLNAALGILKDQGHL